MAMPNHSSIVQQVYDSYPGRWSMANKASCGLFTEAVVTELHKTDPKWGYLSKASRPGGNNWNGHSVDGALYFSESMGQSQHVDFIEGAETSSAKPGWIPDTPRYNPADWINPDDFVVPVHDTLLSASLFWVITGFQKKLDKLKRELDILKTDLGNDIIRGFVILGHDPREGPDPWSIMGTRLDDPTLAETIANVTDLCYDQYEMSMHWTLAGRLYQLETVEAQGQLIDIYSSGIRGREHKVKVSEMANEYLVNGWHGRVNQLHDMARALHSKFPEMMIAFSSPNSLMGQPTNISQEKWEEEIQNEINEIIIPPINAFTYHATRPVPVFGPGHHLMAPFSFVINGEPRGIGASAGGDVNSENVIGGDYESSKAANEKWDTCHTTFGVFGGECDPAYPDENKYQSFRELPNWTKVSATLNSIRHGGSAVPTPKPEYPGDQVGVQIGEMLFADYARAGQAPNPGMGVWEWRCSWDVSNEGLTVDESIAKHRAEWCKELGIPVI